MILVNGVPEQVTTFWHMAKQAVKQLESRNREARIVPCVEVPEGYEDFITEEPTEPELEHGPEV